MNHFRKRQNSKKEVSNLSDLEEGRGKKDDNIETDPSHSCSTSETGGYTAHHKSLFALLILLIGGSAAAAFLTIGIVGANNDEERLFAQRATALVKNVQSAWSDYETFGLWIHQACRKMDLSTHLVTNETVYDEGCSRRDFRELYEYILSIGLSFQSAQFMPNVTHENRAFVEQESRDYYAETHEDVNYRGVTGIEPDPLTGKIGVNPRSDQPYYFPVHRVEPVEGNEAAIELDIYSSRIQQKTLEKAVQTWMPALTDRLVLVQEAENPDIPAYSVILHHPGVPTSTLQGAERPLGLSLMVVRIPDLIARAAANTVDGATVYIYDSSDDSALPVFLGGFDVVDPQEISSIAAKPEISLNDVTGDRLLQEQVTVADRQWTIAVTPLEGTYKPNIVFVSLGGCMIAMASVLLAVWFYTAMNRAAKMTKLRATVEAEKAAVIVDSAKRQAVAERELNDFIAHEVRNPLSSAIAALSFVSSYTSDPSRNVPASVQEDVGIIESSLQFINELLRNMLDMHRASSKQMHIKPAPTDVLLDVFKPVRAMIHLRSSTAADIQIDCPEHLIIQTDKLRLKQTILNLANNAIKFVEKGFIRLRAEVHNGKVRLYVEDSGVGIPIEKRNKLFNKFQESLDQLNQGTGIGLNLCKNLTNLLGGDIWLDEEYDSGVEGFPGTCFVVELNQAPLRKESFNEDENESSQVKKAANGGAHVIVNRSNPSQELPENLSVLFVDDDFMIRKLFRRTIKRAAPTWMVDEASNGESALEFAKNKQYDLIFVDQYMASVEKSLLGTETVAALRARGETALICGISANDMEEQFIAAGAESFLFKPFKCQKEAMAEELSDVLKRKPTADRVYGTRFE